MGTSGTLAPANEKIRHKKRAANATLPYQFINLQIKI